ncbi:MAG TPA: GGDEF domain-containing protein [Gaiellaceae bacterium]
MAEPALARLGEAIRDAGLELALEVVREGLEGDAIPSLARLDRSGQLGDVPTFIEELAREVEHPEPGRMRRGGPLAALTRDHARSREALGFAPREVVTEFLLLRRVLWRFVSRRIAELQPADVFELERRLNDTIDRLVTECVVAYFDRATMELAEQARRDPLTGLLNHQAFNDVLERELVRAERYDHGLTLVFVDLDGFKLVNDTCGHLEGDRVLQVVSSVLRSILRGSDVAGRMGGDEFAVLLLESDRRAGERFCARLREVTHELVEQAELPPELAFSAGAAHYPSEALAADELFRLADARQYQAKRAKRD